MMWNYRIMAHEHDGYVSLKIHEVHYDDDNIPVLYTENAVAVFGTNIKEITWQLNKMQEAKKRPILWANDKFPAECKIKYECELCKRDNFDRPQAHTCNKNYRKRGLVWKTKYF